MARSGAAGRVCYLALFLTAGIVMYQHHKSMQREITHNRNSRDKFEKMYDEVLKQEAEWRSKHDKEKMRSVQLQESIDGMKKQVASEVQSKQTLQSQKTELELKLEQEQAARTKQEADSQERAMQLEQALHDVKTASSDLTGLQTKVTALTKELNEVKQLNVELKGRLEKAELDVRTQADAQSARSTFSQRQAIGQQQVGRDMEEDDPEEAAGGESNEDSPADRARLAEKFSQESHVSETHIRSADLGTKGGLAGEGSTGTEESTQAATEVNTSLKESGLGGGSGTRTYSGRHGGNPSERRGGLGIHWR